MSLLKVLTERPEDLLLPNASMQKEALVELKSALDSVAKNYTPLDSIHVDGLKADQVWVQAQMILEGVTSKLNDKLSHANPSNLEQDLQNSESEDEDELEEESEEGDFEANGEDAPQLDSDLSDDIDLNDISNMHDDFEESEEDNVDQEEEPEGDARSEEQEDSPDNEEPQQNSKKEDQFDLAEFQQHVLQLEQEPEDDDGEEIDYFADIPDSSDDADLHYEDFFGPAPKKARPNTEKKRVKFAEVEDEVEADDELEAESESELGSIMENTRKDLFTDEEDEDLVSDENRMSKFQKQQLELTQQIEELENENVGTKEWGMRGEAQAKDRPEESLYNIQFERNAKPAPVITTESTASIEDLIKERIRKQQFDDIPRRSEAAAPIAKKELAELSDAKSQKSLAELYEDDQMHKENPEYFAQQNSAVLDAAHKEIIDLFTSVSRRLDALSSWQYTPKEPTPSLNIITDKPSISMEEAQPGTLAPEAQLAPQEIFKGGPSDAMDNTEMSTSLKRKKRREKARSKQGSAPTNAGKPGSSRRDKKEEMFNTLKRGNVTMVDKRGSKRDMRGQEVKSGQSASASSVKL